MGDLEKKAVAPQTLSADQTLTAKINDYIPKITARIDALLESIGTTPLPPNQRVDITYNLTLGNQRIDLQEYWKNPLPESRLVLTESIGQAYARSLYDLSSSLDKHCHGDRQQASKDDFYAEFTLEASVQNSGVALDAGVTVKHEGRERYIKFVDLYKNFAGGTYQQDSRENLPAILQFDLTEGRHFQLTKLIILALKALGEKANEKRTTT